MQRTQIVLLVVWFFVIVSFILGITLPIATIEKFIFFDNQFSLLGSIIELAKEPNRQNIFLLTIIVCFTLLFPIAKLLTMFLQIKNHGKNWQNCITRLIESVGHLSMLEVFVIALMVLLLKLGMFVDVYVHQGFYWFSISILMSILLSYGIKFFRR